MRCVFGNKSCVFQNYHWKFKKWSVTQQISLLLLANSFYRISLILWGTGFKDCVTCKISVYNHLLKNVLSSKYLKCPYTMNSVQCNKYSREHFFTFLGSLGWMNAWIPYMRVQSQNSNENISVTFCFHIIMKLWHFKVGGVPIPVAIIFQPTWKPGATADSTAWI